MTYFKTTNTPIYVATVFPQKADRIGKQMFSQPVGANAGHLLGIIDQYSGSPYTYYIGMAWSDLDVRSLEEWSNRVEHFIQLQGEALGLTSRSS